MVHDASKVIRLVETATGRTLARLESPEPSVGWPVFSPDGSRLVVTTLAGPAVHVWNLRTIRRQLLAMGLDWDAPPYSDQDPADPSGPPLGHIEIREFSLSIARGAALAEEGKWEEAKIAYKQAFACGKSDQPYLWFERAALELAVGDRAAYRLTCQQMLDVLDAKQRADVAALRGARVCPRCRWCRPRARVAAPGRAPRRVFPAVFSEHVIGLALYRNGRFAESLARELANIASYGGWRCEVLDRLVVAMSQKRLGRWDEAALSRTGRELDRRAPAGSTRRARPGRPRRVALARRDPHAYAASRSPRPDRCEVADVARERLRPRDLSAALTTSFFRFVCEFCPDRLPSRRSHSCCPTRPASRRGRYEVKIRTAGVVRSHS